MTSATDLAAWLRSLEMRGRIAPAQADDLPRLAQLEQKTNQFNLTTRRIPLVQLQDWLADPQHILLTQRLRDRFADHGLVGSLVAVAFCALFLYAAIPWWYEAWETGATTPSIWRARLWIPYLSVPVGLGLLCLQYATEVFLVLTGRELPFGLGAEERL